MAAVTDGEAERETRIDRGYEIAGSAVTDIGGEYALCAKLDERPSYKASISKALHRYDDNGVRRVPIDWLFAMLDETDAAYTIAAGVVEQASRAMLADPERFAAFVLDVLVMAGGSVVGTDHLHALAVHVCELGGYEPPKKARPLSVEESGSAALECIAELPPDEQALWRERIAKKKGTRPGSVQLGLRGVK